MIPSFLPSLPGGRRDADHGIKSPPVMTCPDARARRCPHEPTLPPHRHRSAQTHTPLSYQEQSQLSAHRTVTQTGVGDGMIQTGRRHTSHSRRRHRPTHPRDPDCGHGTTQSPGPSIRLLPSGHGYIINPPHRAHSSPRASTSPWLVRPMGGLTPIGAIG